MIKLEPWSRVVIKVGSALIAPDGNRCSTRFALAIAQYINECRNKNIEVVLVSSGSVAAGKALFERYGQKKHLTIPEKQALAAVGQREVLAFWQRFFDFPSAQVLLTYDDLASRKRYLNASNTIKQLLDLQVLPIVNENDTVSVDELKVGDNDNLAASVAVLADADALIICSDVDGLYTESPKQNKTAKHLQEICIIDEGIEQMASGAGSGMGTGGMVTKLQAAKKATARGIRTLIVNGKQADTFRYLLAFQNPGTLFHAKESPLMAKKHWLQHSVAASGTIYIDEGAVKAICKKGASLLAIGVQEIDGSFRSGDIVNVNQNTVVLAKGIIQFDSKELNAVKGKHYSEIEKYLHYASNGIVIHRNDMVMIQGG